MSHHWDSGFMVNTPSWHRLENAVLEKSPTSWEDARTQAGLTWEVEHWDVQLHRPSSGGHVGWTQPATGWQGLVRNDTNSLLSIQPESYQVIRNEEFGSVIDQLLGISKDENVVFEALMSLYGGRQIVALAYFEEPLNLPFDDSQNFTYLSFSSRHDGQGGLRVLPTNVRVQCANTLSLAESMSGSLGWTIRHSGQWERRLASLSQDLSTARQGSATWTKFMADLEAWKVSQKEEERYLERLFPISTDMTDRMKANRLDWADQLRNIHHSAPTTEHIRGTGYGLLMSTTEWADHHRLVRSQDSAVSRQLLTAAEPKVRASSILREMASI